MLVRVGSNTLANSLSALLRFILLVVF